jgi:hypothetical protein
MAGAVPDTAALCPPAARAVRLAWALPETRPRPDWLVACMAALAEMQARPPGHPGTTGRAAGTDIGFAPPPGSDGRAATRDIRVHLGPAPAALPAVPAQGEAVHWWLTDRHGRALDDRDPLLDDITAGRGVEIALWAPHPQGCGWVCLRQLHIDADAHYALGRQRLAGAVARLLWHAGLDLQLGARASNHVYPSPRPTGLLAERRLPRPRPRLALLLRGRWRSWVARQRARWFREEWRLGVIDVPVTSLVSLPKPPPARWLAPYQGLGYWADPAAVAGSESRILAEYFDERSGVGRIEQLRFSPSQQGVADRQVMPLGEGRHTSFPNAVQLDGRWLGLAETAALRACVLHEIDAQGHWKPLADLLPGMAAADPALFMWEGRYWLACTDVDQGAMDNLCLFHADRPEGPWLPHANNPVKVDVGSARMAGALFWHQGELYRPAQNCLGTYGASVVLQRVLRCTPTDYEEEPVRQLNPDRHGPCPHGLHTINAWGSRTLVDGKRHVFSPTLGWLKLRRRLGGSAPR